MRKSAYFIVIIILFLQGCSHMQTVRLQPEDYAPPKEIPFTVDDDRAAYLAYHKKAWLEVATNRVYEVDLKSRAVMKDMMDSLVIGPSKAADDGSNAGYFQAVTQLDELVNRAFQDAGQATYPYPKDSERRTDGAGPAHTPASRGPCKL